MQTVHTGDVRKVLNIEPMNVRVSACVCVEETESRGQHFTC